MEISGSSFGASAYAYQAKSYTVQESAAVSNEQSGGIVIVADQTAEQTITEETISQQIQDVLESNDDMFKAAEEALKAADEKMSQEALDAISSEEYVASLEERMATAKTESLDKLAEYLQLPDKELINQVDIDDVEDYISMFKIKYTDTGDSRPVFNKTFDNVEDFWNYKLQNSSAEKPAVNSDNGLFAEDKLYMDGQVYTVEYVDECNEKDGNKLLTDTNPAALQQIVTYWDEGTVGQLNHAVGMAKAMSSYTGVYDASGDTSLSDAFWNKTGEQLGGYGTDSKVFAQLFDESYMRANKDIITDDIAFLEWDMNNYSQYADDTDTFNSKSAIRI